MPWDEMITMAPPLTYDPKIYWSQPIWQIDYRVSRHVLHDARFDMREHAWRHITDNITHQARKQQWGPYVWRDEEISAEYGDVILHREIYSQPGFRREERWQGPPGVWTLRVMRRPGEIEELALQKLWYHGEHARGALFDDVLYVVFDAEYLTGGHIP